MGHDSTRQSIRGVCFFGAYDRDYPRSGVIRRGLMGMGIPVLDCMHQTRLKVFARYPVLSSRLISCRMSLMYSSFPEFRHKDVPLAKMLAQRSGKLLVFDPLVSRYDTRVKDRGDARDHSPQSWHTATLIEFQ